MSEGMPDFIDKLSVYSLTCVLRDLNAALDSGKASDVTFAEVYTYLESGDLVEFLQDRLGADLSAVRPAVKDQNKYFLDAIKHVMNRGREGRVWGVRNSGICLLIAYTTEIIQQGLYDYDSQKFYGQAG
jgi:hypothetical protein